MGESGAAHDEAMEPQREWSIHAACRGHGPTTFYPQGDEAADVARAKAMCEACDVQAECLGHALASGERHGVWGGFTPTERRRILRSLADVGPDAREHRPALALARTYGSQAVTGRPSRAKGIPWVQTMLA